MTPEQVLALRPKVLTQKQRESYFENGYILLKKFLRDDWIERLRTAPARLVRRLYLDLRDSTCGGLE